MEAEKLRHVWKVWMWHLFHSGSKVKTRATSRGLEKSYMSQLIANVHWEAHFKHPITNLLAFIHFFIESIHCHSLPPEHENFCALKLSNSPKSYLNPQPILQYFGNCSPKHPEYQRFSTPGWEILGTSVQKSNSSKLCLPCTFLHLISLYLLNH